VRGLRRPPTRIVASPFARAQETAAPSSQVLGLPIETDPRLAEFASTLPSPWTLAEADELMPYDDIWHPGDAGYDGETIGAFFTRVGASAEEHSREDEVALLVCHAGTTIGIIRWALMIAPREPDAFDLFIPNASLTEIRTRTDRHGRERRHVRRVADVRYLSEVTGI
jgi:broad specificity phosphatase PhoE